MSESEHINVLVSKPGSGLHYIPGFIKPNQRADIFDYLKSLYPIWEKRFSEHRPLPTGKVQRELLRPTYWLGNWQFACLGYYHPPKGLLNRSIQAESYPLALQKAVKRIENFVHLRFAAKDIPKGWHLNTCLINFYGSRIEGNKKVDSGRVGEHKDFEPGPIGSISFGDRALIQFVTSQGKHAPSEVKYQQWLEDCSLQVFGGERYKNQLFHRVQRVENKLKSDFQFHTTRYETRRVNLTFRYVPDEHIIDLEKLPRNLASDIQGYVQELSHHSEFWKSAFKKTYSR